MLRAVSSQTLPHFSSSSSSSAPTAPSLTPHILSSGTTYHSNAPSLSLQGHRVSLPPKSSPQSTLTLLQNIVDNLQKNWIHDAMDIWHNLSQTLQLHDPRQTQVLSMALRKIFSQYAVAIIYSLYDYPRLTPQDHKVILSLAEHFRTLPLPQCEQAPPPSYLPNEHSSSLSADCFLIFSISSFCTHLMNDRWESACHDLLILNQYFNQENNEWTQKRTELINLLFSHWFLKILSSQSCTDQFDLEGRSSVGWISLLFHSLFFKLLSQQIALQIPRLNSLISSIPPSPQSLSSSLPSILALSPPPPLALLYPTTPDSPSLRSDPFFSTSSPAAKKARSSNGEGDSTVVMCSCVTPSQKYQEPKDGVKKRKRSSANESS